MDKRGIEKIIAKVERQNEVFAKKASLSTLSRVLPEKIVGRENQTEQLVRYLMSFKNGIVVTLISIFGRSGTGKSTLPRYVCQNIPDVMMCFVNLRKTKTVFGVANLILSELGQTNSKSAQGMNVAIDMIGKAILDKMNKTKNKLFVLVLDEFDVLFNDKRGNPSDFVYKLVEMQADLNDKGCLVCIITISNNVIADYALEDRVKSRIGNSEIYFEPYSKNDIYEILFEMAKDAFNEKIDDKVLWHCAQKSHLEHGDARRATDLLRLASEIALERDESISTSHVDMALEKLQQDRFEKVLPGLSYHSKLLCLVIAKKTFGLEEDWHYTSAIFEKYQELTDDPLGYRSVSGLLTDLADAGILESRTSSKGRNGYGSEFKLKIAPDIVGKLCDTEWWQKNVVDRKKSIPSVVVDGITIPIQKPSKSDPMYMSYLKYEAIMEEDKKYW